MSKKKRYTYELATIDKVENGIVTASYPLDLANADPIRAGRYTKLANGGDEEAQKKLDEMKKTLMVRIIEEDKE